MRRIVLALALVGCSGSQKKSSNGEIVIPPDIAAKSTPDAASETAPEPTTVDEQPSQPPADPGPASLDELEVVTKREPAGSQWEIARRLNDEGIVAVKTRRDWATSAQRFREAVARVPHPAYFFNLCFALYEEGKYGEALTACDAVGKGEPVASPALQDKTAKMNLRIQRAAKQL